MVYLQTNILTIFQHEYGLKIKKEKISVEIQKQQIYKDFSNYFQTITIDGGEFRGLAGEFNKLREVPKEAWDMIEQMIRSTNKKSKV